MKLPSSPSCENNKHFILEVLQRAFGASQSVLEIGSGTGQHAVYFAPRLAHATWQTSDLVENHPGINAWRSGFPADNVLAPLDLDVDASQWPVEQEIDAVFTANTCHIMAWSSVANMIAQVGNILGADGVLAIYGPFNYDQQYISPSNARFDDWLKARAAHQGIRDFEAVNELARAAGMTLLEDNAMPANNRLLVWRKTG